MWPAFPSSDYYGPSAPPPGRQPTAGLPAADLDGRQVGEPGSGSHVHHQPFNGVGAQLFPCSLATVTPQAFTVASSPAITSDGRSRPPRWACTAARPRSTRFEPVTLLRGFHHWFLHSYTFPSCLPDPACLAVPGRPVVVRAAPTWPRDSEGQAALSFSGLLRQPGGGSFHPTRLMAPRGARDERVVVVGGEQGQLTAGGGLGAPHDQPDRLALFGFEGLPGGLGHIGAVFDPVRDRRPRIGAISEIVLWRALDILIVIE